MIRPSYVTISVTNAISKADVLNTFKKAVAATQLSLRKEKVVLVLTE